MRFWPRRRRAEPAASSPLDRFFMTDLLRRQLDDVFAVYDAGEKDGVFLFRGQLAVEPTRGLDILRERFDRLGYTPYLQADGGTVVLQAVPAPPDTARPRTRINVILFVLTVVSTLFAGTSFVGSPTFDAFRRASSWWWVLSGVPFAVTLLATLAFHEFGHYFTARYYRVPVSLPYFIPAPWLPGTLGAVIRMRAPAADRNALFDIAAAGPLAGLLIALPAIVLGIHWSVVAPSSPGFLVFGDSLLTHALVTLRHGPIPDGMKLYTHPVFDAAWFGLLVTALNLMPVGQLDGGRIVYAVFGRAHRLIGVTTFWLLLLLGAVTWSPNWVIWGLFLFFIIGFRHGPPLDDVTPLAPWRRVVGYACLVLLVLLVPPIPIEIFT